MYKNKRPFAAAISPVSFFALTYLLSWLIWVPLAMSHFAVGPLRVSEQTSGIVRLLGVLMPAVAAILLAAWSGGRGAVKALLSRLALWRVGRRWWLAAVLVQPLLLVLAGLIYNVFSGSSAIAVTSPASAGALIVQVIFLLIATLGEEIGWRGAALPALQQRSSAVKASAILGFLWATWHLPFWLLLDTFDRFGFGYLALNVLLVFPMTFYVTWFFNHSRASLLLPVACHLTFNIVNTALAPVTTNLGAFGILIALEWALALLVLPRLESEPAETPRLAFL